MSNIPYSGSYGALLGYMVVKFSFSDIDFPIKLPSVSTGILFFILIAVAAACHIIGALAYKRWKDESPSPDMALRIKISLATFATGFLTMLVLQ